MSNLHSNLTPDHSSNFYPVKLVRKDDAGMIFLTCDDIPELFLALCSEDEIRNAIDEALKITFKDSRHRPQVYTNGKVDGPVIDAVVRIN